MTFWLPPLGGALTTLFFLFFLTLRSTLRIAVLALPKGDPIRNELTAGLHKVARVYRPRWVFMMTSVALVVGLSARLRSRRGCSERAIRTAERPVHFLLAIAVRLLPPSERARYFDEFRAELLDVHRNRQLRHVLSLLRGAFVIRLRRGPKSKATDAAVRRAKG